MSITVTDRRAPAAAPSTASSTAQLYAALAAFQAELPHISADKAGDVHGENAQGKKYSYKFRYANLGDISPVVMPLLAKHGLAFTAKPTYHGDRFVLVYKLTHTSGEEDGGTYPLPDPNRTDPQKLGGAITYARRYTLCAVTGVAPTQDDDDARGSRNAPAATPPPSPADTARAEIIAVMEAQQLNANHVIQGYYRRHKLDLRDDQDVARLRAFATSLRKDPDAALAVDPGTGQPTGPRAVKDAS